MSINELTLAEIEFIKGCLYTKQNRNMEIFDSEYLEEFVRDIVIEDIKIIESILHKINRKG